MWAKTLSKI